MDLEIECGKATIESKFRPQPEDRVTVLIEDPNWDSITETVLENATIEEVLKHFDSSELIKEIPINDVAEEFRAEEFVTYFGIEEVLNQIDETEIKKYLEGEL